MSVSNWKTFGHDKNKTVLDLQIEADAVAQSYMFIGPKGLGKLTLAKEFSSKLLGLDTASSPDFLYIDADTASVEELRAFLGKTKLSSNSKYKTFIVDNADNLNASGSNALLKVLEEPQSGLVIILVCHAASLPATIFSRCQVLSFYRFSNDQLQEWLTSEDLHVRQDAVMFAGGTIGLLQEFQENHKILEDLSQELEILQGFSAMAMHEKIEAVIRLSNWEKHELARLFTAWLDRLIATLPAQVHNIAQSSKVITAINRLKEPSVNSKFLLQQLLLE